MTVHTLLPDLPAYAELEAHAARLKSTPIEQLFEQDDNRTKVFSLNAAGLSLDFSKQLLDTKARISLLDLAEQAGVRQSIENLFSGTPINNTEERPALHTLLRASQAGKQTEKFREVLAARTRMRALAEGLNNGEHKGYSGHIITDVVNIGIGGSDLGPRLVTDALRPFHGDVRCHYVANVDPADLRDTLKCLNAETTLFIICSKSFRTEETLANSLVARAWVLNAGATTEDLDRHFLAVTSNLEAAEKFGIPPDNCLPMWDWVGGRYSLWSSIGLSIACTIGYEHFESLLQGAHHTDLHFKERPLDQNIPVLLAMIGVWYNNFFEAESEAILPYDQYMHRFSAYFQQGNMESNGKSTDRSGTKINYQTGPIIWGEPGTNGQHAFYQLIHQGTKLIPCDFLAPAKSHNPLSDHHSKLMSNFFAQTEALMNGKTEKEVSDEMAGKSLTEISDLLNYKVFEGNRPTNSLLFKELTPHMLGRLIALYEHKIFVQGVIWNVYSFDQWGVELGKQLAKKILPELHDEDLVSSHDNSTNGLINTYKIFR